MQSNAERVTKENRKLKYLKLSNIQKKHGKFTNQDIKLQLVNKVEIHSIEKSQKI